MRVRPGSKNENTTESYARSYEIDKIFKIDSELGFRLLGEELQHCMDFPQNLIKVQASILPFQATIN